MLTLVKKIDSANGYVFGGKHEEGNLTEMLSHAAGADFEYFKYPFVVKLVTQIQSYVGADSLIHDISLTKNKIGKCPRKVCSSTRRELVEQSGFKPRCQGNVIIRITRLANLLPFYKDFLSSPLLFEISL